MDAAVTLGGEIWESVNQASMRLNSIMVHDSEMAILEPEEETIEDDRNIVYTQICDSSDADIFSDLAEEDESPLNFLNKRRSAYQSRLDREVEFYLHSAYGSMPIF